MDDNTNHLLTSASGESISYTGTLEEKLNQTTAKTPDRELAGSLGKRPRLAEHPKQPGYHHSQQTPAQQARGLVPSLALTHLPGNPHPPREVAELQTEVQRG